MNASGWMGLALMGALPVHAEEIGCLSTTFRFLGANDKVCVEAFDDPQIPGVSCHISQARTGGIKGPLGLAEDPSRFAIACRQTGPIVLAADIEGSPMSSISTVPIMRWNNAGEPRVSRTNP